MEAGIEAKKRRLQQASSTMAFYRTQAEAAGGAGGEKKRRLEAPQEAKEGSLVKERSESGDTKAHRF